MPLMLVLVAVMASGCISHYRVATGTPAARVRLLTNTEENTRFDVIDPASCPRPSRKLLAATGKIVAAMGREEDLGMIGPSPEPPARTRERWLVAGERIYIAVGSVAADAEPSYRCAAGISFVPVPGGQYELRYLRDEAAGTCGAQVLRLRPPIPDPTKAEPTQQGFRALRPETLCAAG